MAFKEGKVDFTPKTKFTDELTCFVSKEAGFVTTESNEAASANIDAIAEKAVTASASKNRTQQRILRTEQKEMKSEQKEMQGEIRDLKSKLQESRTEIEDVKKELHQMVETNRIHPSNPSFSKEEITAKKEEIKGKERFVEKQDIRIAEKQTDMKKAQDTKKQHKKSERKATKKAAAKTSVAGMLRAKKEVSNDLAGGGAVSGDAFTDGKTGLLGTLMEYMNPMHYLKAWLAKLAAVVAPYALLLMTSMCVIIIVISLLFSVMAPMAAVGEAITNFLSIFSVDTDTFSNTAMTTEEIDTIVADSGCDETQEKVLRYALSKVGYPYSQENRTSGTAYDCSSLAYYAWQDAGCDISFGSGYPPTAAEGARVLNNAGKTVASAEGSSFDMKPGDLIYYGGSDNGRYLGIYHVAIYVGNGKAVEALNTRYGVVYQTVRTNNVIMVCRPNL